MALQIFTLPAVTVVEANTAYPIYDTLLYAASITIQAAYNNTGRIAVGGDTVTPSTGILIDKGESAVIEFPPDARNAADFEVNKIYVTSSSAGDTVRVSIIKRNN